VESYIMNYLLNRHGYYYFRLAIPKALQSRFKASELVRSLRTKSLAEAKEKALIGRHHYKVPHATQKVLLQVYTITLLIKLAESRGTQRLSRDAGYQTLVPGTKLVRVWKDKTYTLIVKEDGFQLGRKHFTSLSRAARSITGTVWNGWIFFGLNKDYRS
jgi:hypothetical protein